jgi:hypothetical protein
MTSTSQHLAAIAFMAQSERRSSLTLSRITLHEMAELIRLYGGSVTVEPISENRFNPTIYCRIAVNNCEVWAFHYCTNLALMLQKESFRANESIFEKGTQLTIIDNQYLILSDASK